MHMKVLVVLANYGTSNDAYLQRVLEEYRQMPYDVDIVVFSNVSKTLGPDIEVLLPPPPKDPYAFPFAHKKILAERMHHYDLFIYSEDDTLYTQRNIEAFLRATEVLPEDEIAGFLNTETDAKDNRYFCNVNLCFHWDPGSVKSRGGYTFAYFTNEHSASYVLTRRHLQQAIESGGFLVEPHEGRYQLRESAATDPYTQCGFKKMICLSHLDDFLIRHLPGVKFASRPFAARAEFQRQIDALLEIGKNGRPGNLLFDPETKILHTKWSKDYYEPIRSEILSQLPAGVRSVLSIGCGWGASEGHLVQKGLRVVGVPMDSVIAACAEAKGVEIVYGDFQTARGKLANESFDCVLLSNVLHLVRDPAAVLSTFADLLSPQGVVIASAPNLGRMPIWLGRLRGKPQYRGLGSYEKTGLHLTSARLVRKWFKQCRLKVESIKYMIPPRAEAPHRLLGGLADPLIGNELIARGRKI
jgi:2-polyprenyl-3-methyl-5-hydroxy-6-metoxy-1,4-benzoquinol methylase